MEKITFKDVSKAFQDTVVFNNFNLAIDKGVTTCIMGTSGKGKTTLLNLLLGFEKPDSGTITGVDSEKSAVFQEDRLCESFSVLSNIKAVCSKNISENTILQNLNQVGLGENINIPVKDLSGGMKRRVAVVRGVMAPGNLILMDEPFKGLDENTKAQTIEYVKQHTKNKTLIVVTHDIDEVDALGANLVNIGE